MAIQYSTAVNNAKLDAIETSIGTAALLKFYTGSVPANCGTAASGTLLATLSLPSDWMAAASGNAKTKAGTWSGTGSAAGVAGYFRITDTAGTTVGMQGTCAVGTGDCQLDNTNIAVSQAITVTSFTITAANQ